MMTDYHTHILPEIDDGSKDKEMSLEMLGELRKQGIEQVIATPHFYSHREKSVVDFIEKRRLAYDKIKNNSPFPIMLGAEVAIEHNISEVKDIEKLAIEGTRLILLELPYRRFEDWITEEVYNISVEYGLKVILAHIHRYINYYGMEQLEKILSTDCIFQINNEVYESFSERSFIKKIFKQSKQVVFGSDTHNMTTRKPNWNLMKRKCKADILEGSNAVLEKYKV